MCPMKRGNKDRQIKHLAVVYINAKDEVRCPMVFLKIDLSDCLEGRVSGCFPKLFSLR